MQEKDLKSSKPKECVISIIQDASENYAHIQRNVRALQDIHSQYGDEVNGWIEVCLAKVLSSRCGIRNAEGALRFFEVYLKKGFNGPTGKLKTFKESRSKLVGDLLTSLHPGINDQERVVRYRSCQMIALILNHLEELDEDVYQKLKAQLTVRTGDKDSDVRVQAVVALSGLQDSGDTYGNRDVTNAILNVMQNDPSASVRKSALWNIEISKKTLPFIIKMASDADYQLRSSVFKKLNRERPEYNLLSTEQREDLLHKGLTDSSREVVKSAIRLLLEGWGRNYQNSIPKMLENLLDVTNSRTGSLVVRSLLEAGFSIGIDYSDQAHMLTAEETYTLRVAWDHYNRLKNFDALETLLPSVGASIGYIEHWYNAMVSSNKSRRERFTFEQLLELAKRQDYSDELWRTATIDLLEKILSAGTSLDSEDIHSIIQLLYIVYSNTESWCKKALELATPYASLGDDEVLKLFSADATTRRPSLPPSILKEDFDPDCLGPTAEIVKCFNIAKAVFRILDIGDLKDKSLLRIVETFIRDLVYLALQSRNVFTYILGLQTLSIYIISDKDLFAKHAPLFKDPNFNHMPIVHETIKVLTDGMLLYGSTPVSTLETTLHDLLVIALSNSDDSTLLIGAEAAAKLLMSRRLPDGNLLKRLCLLYLLSKDSGQTDLHECLFQFFSSFSSQSHVNKLLIQKAFVPTIEELSTCMDDEKLSEVLPYISNCANIIMDFLASPLRDAENSDAYDIFPLCVLRGLLDHINHQVIKSVLINSIQNPYASQCSIDPAQTRNLKNLSDQISPHLTTKDRKTLAQMIKVYYSSESGYAD